jgi:hypothetical protein
MCKDEALVAIAAIDKALLINLQPDARMAKRGAAGNVGGAIARDAVGSDTDGFGLGDHEPLNSKRRCCLQLGVCRRLLVNQGYAERTRIDTRCLIGPDIEPRADAELEHACG